MKRMYTYVRPDGIEVRMYSTADGMFEIVTGMSGSMFRTEMRIDNIADAYRAYNQRIVDIT